MTGLNLQAPSHWGPVGVVSLGKWRQCCLEAAMSPALGAKTVVTHRPNQVGHRLCQHGEISWSFLILNLQVMSMEQEKRVIVEEDQILRVEQKRGNDEHVYRAIQNICPQITFTSSNEGWRGGVSPYSLPPLKFRLLWSPGPSLPAGNCWRKEGFCCRGLQVPL